MHGPHPAGHFTRDLRPNGGRRYRFLRRGKRYRVIRAFTDHDGDVHPVGEEWMFLGYSYLPYDMGMSFFVSPDGQREWHIRLQWRADEQAHVLDDLRGHIARSRRSPRDRARDRARKLWIAVLVFSIAVFSASIVASARSGWFTCMTVRIAPHHGGARDPKWIVALGMNHGSLFVGISRHGVTRWIEFHNTIASSSSPPLNPFTGTLGFHLIWNEFYHTVFVPWWFAAVLSAAAGAGAVWRLRRKQPAGVCRQCGYDLRATPERCPECGAPARAET